MRQIYILLCFFIIKSLHAQYSVGLFSGYTNNHLRTNISNRLFTENKNGNSISTGLIFNYAYKTKIQLQTELALLQKNYSFVRTGLYSGIFTKYRNTYLQLPVIFKYKLLQKCKWVIWADAGFFVSYWVDGSINGVIPNVFNNYYTVDRRGSVTNYIRFSDYFQKHIFSSEKDNRFEVGPLVGITSVYQLNSSYSVFINARFYSSFLSQQKQYTVNQVMQYNQTSVISTGGVINFHAKNR
ncbi:outer membrane beta-barrel protein [Hydrotalea sandarakina]|jgi:hypothetical protein|uniref:Outer membrane protein with beta-barrel domain n=1 Tax=Hydrotalea sandarakina TaxID=1004304 RepID=A0A2W7RJ78_9BACT|nr:outer membrane beta-barrel protein [Hydrotalea sandarakina]PZX60918.1 outer membrane protein with beta-barrel domain [Hydrotalea sandarakina]